MLLETVCKLHWGGRNIVKSHERHMNKIPQKETLLEIFQWRVRQSAGDVAFKFNDHEMTYGEYDARANQVANGIIKSGCLPNSRIAVLAKNSMMYAEILMDASNQGQRLWALTGGLPHPKLSL